VGVRRWILIALLMGCGSRSPSAGEPDEDEEFDESVFAEGDAPPPAPPVRRPEPDPLPLPTADPRAAFRLADDAYNLGEYATAVGYFKATYQLHPDAVLLFDIAQAFRMMDDCYNAVAYYRRYLAAVPGAKNRGDVEQRVAELLERCPDA
jgi:hypothetical protein